MLAILVVIRTAWMRSRSSSDNRNSSRLLKKEATDDWSDMALLELDDRSLRRHHMTHKHLFVTHINDIGLNNYNYTIVTRLTQRSLAQCSAVVSFRRPSPFV